MKKEQVINKKCNAYFNSQRCASLQSGCSADVVAVMRCVCVTYFPLSLCPNLMLCASYTMHIHGAFREQLPKCERLFKFLAPSCALLSLSMSPFLSLSVFVVREVS